MLLSISCTRLALGLRNTGFVLYGPSWLVAVLQSVLRANRLCCSFQRSARIEYQRRNLLAAYKAYFCASSHLIMELVNDRILLVYQHFEWPRFLELISADERTSKV